MREEILINVTPQETRVATVENGMVQEIFIERARSRGIAGNIYLGVVVRVLPGMQAAFIDIGLERTAFLHARDLVPRNEEENHYQQNDPTNSISSLLSEGQRIMVQAIKDPIGTKGARLTGQISIPARNIVLLPESEYVGISIRIQGAERRTALLGQLRERVADSRLPGGYILRTAGENASSEELLSEITLLNRVWDRVSRKTREVKAPALIHRDLPLASRVVRDLEWEHVEKVRIDSRETCEHVKEFVQDLIPEAIGRIEHYPGARPIFDLYNVEDEIQKALQRKVPLKSGGYLIIDQTEAMTTIDINTGSYVGKRNLEETIFKTNLEAASTLARQLRLRNIGGIVIVDFIDMALQEHCDQVMRTLKRELERDDSRTSVNDMTSLGLVEITRKRTRESLEHLLTETCTFCDGRGLLKTPETICYEIFREILRAAREFDASRYMVVASPMVIDLLLEEESTGIADLEDFIHGQIKLQVDTAFHQEKYDVVLM
jgi:ribonuclease G